jgi:PAS domain S-box-containing protein
LSTAIEAALALLELLTAILLLSQASLSGSRALLLLACGYLFTGLAAAVALAPLPQALGSGDRQQAVAQFLAWLNLIGQSAFCASALCYAVLKGRRGDRITVGAGAVLRGALMVGVLGAALLWLAAGARALPSLSGDGRDPSMTTALSIAVGGTGFAALLVLSLRRPRAVLDLWLLLAIAASLFGLLLSGLIDTDRHDLGSICGRVFGLLAAGLVPAMLLIEARSRQAQSNALARDRSDAAAIRRERPFACATGTVAETSFDAAIWCVGSEAAAADNTILVPDERRREVRDILDRVQRGIALQDQETIRVSSHGRVTEMTRDAATADAAGPTTVARDVTEQIWIEQKIELALEASPGGLLLIAGDGAIIRINARTERLFGYGRDELLGQMVELLLPTANRTAHAALRERFAEQSATRQMGALNDVHGRRKDGSEFPIEVRLTPIHTRSGLLVLAIIVDVSEIRASKLALLESQQMARSIIDTALDGFVQIDQAGIVADCNQQAATIFGWSRQDMIGRLFLQSMLLEDSGTDGAAFVQSLQFGEGPPAVRRFEVAARRRDDSAITVELSLAVSRRQGGRVFNVFIRDITASREAEAHFRQAQKMDAVGQLTGGIAHDFNNILTVITGTIEILAEAVADRPQLAAIARLIDNAAVRGADLTQHLLAFARKQPLQPVEVDVNALVMEVARLLRPTLGEHIAIESMLADDAGPALIDPSQLTTALLNLALNSRDSMPDGGKLRIETRNVGFAADDATPGREVGAGDYVMIAVHDSGVGIPARLLSRVFEPFFTTKDVGLGTGLGLSMVYGFVKQSGGHIHIDSEEGRGTCVRIYLPLAIGPAPAPKPLPPSSVIERGHEVVLVVEDDALVREFVVTQVESLGYATLSAGNAAEALTILAEDDRIELLFTDVIMPGTMNGRQLAIAAQRLRPGLKVLYTSGYPHDAIVHDGRVDAGILLLAKPYRKSDLARVLRKALAQA